MNYCHTINLSKTVLVLLVVMCLNNCQRGTDTLQRNEDNLNFDLESVDSCDYVNVNKTLTYEPNSLKCVQMNVRGISSKKTRSHASH